MSVNLNYFPHIVRNCRTADEVTRRLVALVASMDTEGMEIVCVYPMPAAHPEGDEPQYDVTVLLKRTVPAE